MPLCLPGDPWRGDPYGIVHRMPGLVIHEGVRHLGSYPVREIRNDWLGKWFGLKRTVAYQCPNCGAKWKL